MRRLTWTLVAMGMLGISSAASADTGAGTTQPYVPAGGYETTTGGQPPPAGGQTTAPPPGTPVAPTGQREATRFVERGLTLSERTLAIDAEFFYLHIPSVEAGGISVDFDPIVGITAGAGFGIIENLEAGATVLPILLSPDADYGNPSIYGIYRFLTGQVEIGVQADFLIPVQDGSDPVIGVGVPVVIHVGNFGRLNTGLFYRAIFAGETCTTVGTDEVCTDGEFTYGWSIPIEYYLNFTDELFAGLELAVSWSEFDFDPSMTIPLGLRVGYTIAGQQGPIADISGFFGWPAFLTPLSDGDSVTADLFTFGLTGRVFLYL